MIQDHLQTKGILFDGHEILETRLIPTGANPKRAMQSLYNEFKQIADLKETQVYTVTTGYGRDLLEESDKKITEITCHGVGANYLSPNINAVIDIGGQDSKVILLDKDSNIKDFLMKR